MTGKPCAYLGTCKGPKGECGGIVRGQQEICFSQEQVKGREAGVGAGVNDVGTGVLGACGGWTRSHLKVLSREGM